MLKTLRMFNVEKIFERSLFFLIHKSQYFMRGRSTQPKNCFQASSRPFSHGLHEIVYLILLPMLQF